MIVDFFFQNSRFHGSKDPGLMIFLDSEFDVLRIQGSMDPLKKTLHYFSENLMIQGSSQNNKMIMRFRF